MKTPLVRFAGLMIFWGAAAVAAGATHVLLHLPLVVAPVLIASLAVGFSVGSNRVDWLRKAWSALGLRGLLVIHLGRFVGAYFLFLQAQGRLPAEFAERAGWGDIVAAAGALGLLLWPAARASKPLLALWNTVGVIDLLIAVGTAGWLNATRPGAMAEVASLPLTLVPLWAVPVLLGSHMVVFRWLRANRDAHEPTTGSLPAHGW